jgi:hypothetical protein
MIMRLAYIIALALAVVPAPADNVRASQIEEHHLSQLLTIRRVFVDRLTGGETAAQMRDMLISSLQNARLFVITENEDRCDAILRGSGEDLVYTDTHDSNENVSVRANLGISRSSRDRNYGGVGLGESESSRSSERRHEAVAAVRLVNKEGDVIWSTTQESMGAKFRGASADVADKVVRTLKEDYERALKLRRPE